MENSPTYGKVRIDKGIAFSLFILVLMLVLHGTYLRTRSGLDVPTMDWLVLARLTTCILAGIIAVISFRKGVHLGFGAKVILLFVMGALISAANSPLPKIVIGYSILLLGASLLMISLINRAQDIKQLKQIETIWLMTVLALIVKDSIIGLISFSEVYQSEEIFRLGMGVTHANELSMLSAIAFWLSFRGEKWGFRGFLMWIVRCFLVFVIISAISRVSISSFLAGGILYLVFRSKYEFKLKLALIAWGGVLVTLFLLSVSFNFGPSNDIIRYITRGQEKEDLSTFTGRTLIWKHAVGRAFESPFIGRGYGISRFTMGSLPKSDYQPPHSHNEFIEVFLNMGIVGLIPFVLMIIYSLKWIIDYGRLKKYFSDDLALHAVCVVGMLMLSSIFEVRIAGRLSTIHPLFFFYILILDRKADFSRKKTARFTVA